MTANILSWLSDRSISYALNGCLNGTLSRLINTPTLPFEAISTLEEVIPEAMKDSDILIATTVRKRDFHIPSIKLQDISKLNPNKISILFGQENNGLTNKEISHANYILSIPTKSNSSLNLSHTVALIAYELSQMSFSKISSSKIATPASAIPS